MLTIVRSNDRGKANHGWLKSYHTFSFADYFNRNAMGFQSLRVINEDFVAPGMGFPTHPHSDMEIISYVVSGQISHKDSMGNVKTVAAGEVQAMTAGTGVEHSEFNPSDSEMLHLLQIWIKPDRRGYEPSYSEWRPKSFENQKLQLIASSKGVDGSIHINQNADLQVGNYNAGEKACLDLQGSNAFWLQLINGKLVAGGQTLEAGDAINGEGEKNLEVVAEGDSRFLLFRFG